MKRLSSFGFISNQSSVEKRARSDIVRTIIIRASGSMGGVSSGCGRGFKNCARYTFGTRPSRAIAIKENHSSLNQ